jgi:hypothetical protein
MKTNILSRDYPLQTKDHGFIGLDPIESDDGDDDDDDGDDGGGGGGGCGDYSSSGDKEGNTTQMVAIEKVRDGAAQHSMSSQAYTTSGMYVHVLLLIDILTLNEVFK